MVLNKQKQIVINEWHGIPGIRNNELGLEQIYRDPVGVQKAGAPKWADGPFMARCNSLDRMHHSVLLPLIHTGWMARFYWFLRLPVGGRYETLR